MTREELIRLLGDEWYKYVIADRILSDHVIVPKEKLSEEKLKPILLDALLAYHEKAKLPFPTDWTPLESIDSQAKAILDYLVKE